VNIFTTLSHSRLYVFIMGFCLLAAASLCWQLTKFPGGQTDIRMFDVPGEAIFITLPEGHRVLMDAGDTGEITEKLSSSLPFWSRSIDVLVLSHMDRDHIAGTLPILKQFRVGMIFLPGTADASLLSDAIRKEIARQHIGIIYSQATTDFRTRSALFDVLAPQTSLLGKNMSKRNETSAIIRLKTADGSLLLTGDSEQQNESDILTTPVRLASTILKAPHHGSKTSSSPAFLSAVAPRLALISAHRDNPFGHPHQEVLERYAAKGIAFLSTGRDNDIRIRTLKSPPDF